MKILKPLLAAFICFTFFALPCGGKPASSAAPDFSPDQAAHAGKTNWISAADPCFRYEGRFDFSDSNAPVVIWQASRIRLDFEGDTLVLYFDNTQGQSFFNAQVDNSNTVVEVLEEKPVHSTMLSGLGAGRHHLMLFKRSEAGAGTVRFRGIEIEPAAKAWAPAATPHQLQMEFIGDSITAGACNEDGATDSGKTAARTTARSATPP